MASLMDPTLRPLVDLAFGMAEATNANAAIAEARAAHPGARPTSYEVVVAEGQNLAALAEAVLPRLIYHLDSLGARPPHWGEVFLSLFIGSQLHFVQASDALPLLLAARGLPVAGALALTGAPGLHVEAASAPGGDGSSERPFTRVADAVAAAPVGATVFIETGLYEEALRLPRAIVLVGVGTKVVLAAPPGEAVAVRVGAEVELRDLAVQGGRAGIQLEGGRATLTRVGIRGQPDVALDCGRWPCRLDGVRFEASFASAVGLRAAGTVECHQLILEGPFKRALDLQPGARLRGREVTVRGAAAGLQEEGAEVDLTDLEVEDARLAGVFADGGRVRLVEPVIARCAYGLLARDGARLTVRGAVVARCTHAALAGTQADVELSDWVGVGPTTDAVLAFDGGTLRLDGALLRSPGSTGLRARLVHGSAAHVTVLDARLDGHAGGNAVFLADATLRLDDLDAERLEGPAVEAQLGDSQVRGLIVVEAPTAVAWEFQARLDVAGLLHHRGSGTSLACIEGGRGQVIAPRFDGLAMEPWLVDCSCQLTVRPPADVPTCAPAPTTAPRRQTIPPRPP